MVLTLDELNKAEEFDSITLKDIDTSLANFSGKSFYGCEFVGLAAMEADLSNSVFEDCRFYQCDLTMVSLLGASLRGVEFRNCKLMGIDWSPAGGLTFSVSFDSCILSHCLFTDLRMKDTQITDCKAHEASFAGVDLQGANFSGCDLRDARFLGTNLEGADLSTAENYMIDPGDNRLRDTKFSVEAALALASKFGVIV
jgi:fluoroquinolone resistance protein